MVLSNIDVFVWSWPAQHSNIDSTNSMSLGVGLSVWSANCQLRVVMHKLHTSPLHLLLFYICKSQICIHFWLSCRLLDLFNSGTDLFFCYITTCILKEQCFKESKSKHLKIYGCITISHVWGIAPSKDQDICWSAYTVSHWGDVCPVNRSGTHAKFTPADAQIVPIGYRYSDCLTA